MAIKAIIFDLDNTLYPSASIAEELFTPVYELISRYDAEAANNPELHEMMQRKPFQDIVKKFNFDEELEKEATALLANLTWDKDMQPYEGFESILTLPQRKFLVTAGFTKLQYSKVKALNLDKHFEGIYIIDPEVSDASKRDRFEEILQATELQPEEVLVIGDDYDSEIKGGLDLDMPVILYDSLGIFSDKQDVPRINKLEELITQLPD